MRLTKFVNELRGYRGCGGPAGSSEASRRRQGMKKMSDLETTGVVSEEAEELTELALEGYCHILRLLRHTLRRYDLVMAAECEERAIAISRLTGSFSIVISRRSILATAL